MSRNFASKLAFSVIVAAALVAGFVVFNNYKSTSSIATSTPQTTSSTTPTLITPDYTQPIVFSGNLSADIKAQLTAQHTALQQEIKTNPLNMHAWLSLGSVYKIGGDYEHAVMAWNFIIDVIPSIPAPYSNLGDLYMNALKDYPKAESNYKKVIELTPKAVDAYYSLYMMYANVYKTDTVEARKILELGLKNNPGNSQLTELLAEYNKTHAK